MKKILIIITILVIGCAKININHRSFQFSYKIDVEATENKKLEMWIPLPSSNEVQTISNIIIDTDGLNYTIENEKVHNNKYIYINHKDGTNTIKHIIITFNVLRKEHQNIVYKNVDPKKYLNSYNTVPTGGVFDKIIAENNLSSNNMRNIYNYVLNGMHYGKPTSFDNKYYQEPWLTKNGKYGMKKVNRDQVVNIYKKAKTENDIYTFGNGNSIYACDIGVGNCTDYHSYFMSLSRTVEIPSRFHMGFPVPDGDGGEIKGYHCWADYFIEEEGWYPVDISEADKAPDKIDYFFGNLDYNRVEMVLGRDIKLKGLERETTNLFIYPIMEIDDINSSSYNKSFSYNNL